VLIDLEAEYNNLTKVPEHPAIMQVWARAATAFREAHPVAELDLAYGPSPRQTLDLFWPGADRAAPIALFIHGGYWQRLDKSWFSHLAAGLLSHGVAVAMPSYDLCPNVTLAVIVEQLRDAAEFLARRHGRKLLATGHSAGGHLSAMLLATDWRARDLPEGTVCGGLAISGLFDLPPLILTTLNVALGLDKPEARRLSPLFIQPPVGGARLHAVVGGEEGPEFLRQSRSIAEVWGGTWEVVPGANHFTVLDPLTNPASPMVRAALRLLAS
jgi:arylformamidase